MSAIKSVAQSLLVLWVLGSALPALSGEVEDAAYVAAVEAAKADIANADFGELRALYFSSRFYKGRESEPYNLLAEDPKRPPEEISAFVDENFALMSAHTVALRLLVPEKSDPRRQLHSKAGLGLMRAVLEQVEKKGTALIFPVLAVSEEYFFLNVLELKSKEQSLVEEDGRFYDVLKCVNPKGEMLELWFDVTPLFAAGG